MNKINFKKDILPHLVAIITFYIVTVIFFRPIYFDNKILSQSDIDQWKGGAKELMDYREATGKEGLWTNSMFSGMPGYLINVRWSYGIIITLQKIASLGLQHPVGAVASSFVSFYILLLAFGVRPYLAIGGALAFGLSSFMIIGLAAGHNARISAMAFSPMVIAGIHLVLHRKKWLLGFGLTALAMALHLRLNHLQVTYYLLLVVVVYGLIMLITSFQKGQTRNYVQGLGVLILAVVLALGTFFGQFWATYEYSKFSMRGKSELVADTEKGENSDGLKRDYAFQYSNGIFEPLTLIVPNILGGSSGNFLIQDQESKVYQVLSRSGDQQLANQLVRFTSAYWGKQPTTAPYYVGAVICFLFALGIAFADRKLVIWLLSVTVFAIMLTWGHNFKAFNYFMFDYFPGYNKFRSVTFAISIAMMAMPLLGFMGLEQLLAKGWNKASQRKFLIAFAVTGGLCLLFFLFAGMASLTRTGEGQLPLWFLEALRDDRRGLLRADAMRSLGFIVATASVIFFHMKGKIGFPLLSGLLALLVLLDLWFVDRRYFNESNFVRKSSRAFIQATDADKEIKKDKTLHYRVYNLQGAFADARTSYHHKSLGGYHGAKMRRYQDLVDYCIDNETREVIQTLQGGSQGFTAFGVLNMLNARYFTFGSAKNAFVPNPQANGNAWPVANIHQVQSPDDELNAVCELDTKTTAVVDVSKFPLEQTQFDPSGAVRLTEYRPDYLKYEADLNSDSFIVFSEIYYPLGWQAAINGKSAEIVRANYVLRALKVPKGKHAIEFTFAPKAYHTGDKVILASSIILLLVLLGTAFLELKSFF